MRIQYPIETAVQKICTIGFCVALAFDNCLKTNYHVTFKHTCIKQNNTCIRLGKKIKQNTISLI